MKLVTTIPTFILTLILSFSLNAQTLDEVLQQHFEVIGMDEFAKVKSLVINGNSSSNGMENKYTMLVVKPNYYRIDVPMQGQNMVRAYNNGEAWYIAPWTGSLKPIDVADDQLKNEAKQADLDGPLYNWKEKGNKVELIGKEELEGTEVFKIKVVDKYDDVTFIYMDAENYVILQEENIVKMQGQEIKSVTKMSNYKKIPGHNMIMAYNFDVYYNNQLASSITVEQIDINPEVDMSIFEKPEVTE